MHITHFRAIQAVLLKCIIAQMRTSLFMDARHELQGLIIALLCCGLALVLLFFAVILSLSSGIIVFTLRYIRNM